MIRLNSIESAILHIANMNNNVKNFIYQEWDEKLTDEQKFDVMIQAVEMQNQASYKEKIKMYFF
mgnify:FL=1